MTERQLLEEHITELAEIVGEARKLTQQEYEDWKIAFWTVQQRRSEDLQSMFCS